MSSNLARRVCAGAGFLSSRYLVYNTVVLVDTGGRVVSERIVPHNGSGISRFLDWLIEQTSNSAGQVAVAIETPRGVIVEGLVSANMGSSRSILSNWTGFGIATALLAQRTIVAMHSC